MTFNGWLQIALYAVLIVLIAKPLGSYMTSVFNGERTFLRPVVRPLEVGIYKICGVREDDEQHWVSYAVAMLAFSFAGTSVSFMTNTNRQSYVPETTMSYLTQMIALTVHNFVPAAAGIVLTVVLIRGFARRSMQI